MKIIRKILVFCMCICLAFSSNLSSAHSGRTDSSGGHHDYKNKSGLGSYHYHHGMGPHLHKNGVCPYSAKAKSSSGTQKKSKYYSNSTIKRCRKNSTNLAISVARRMVIADQKQKQQ